MKRFPILLVSLLVILASCSSLGSNKPIETNITEIKKNPQAYKGKYVSITGVVSAKVPMVGNLVQVYDVTDNEFIWIKIGEDNQTPKWSSFVQILGHVETNYRFLGKDYGTIIVTKKILPVATATDLL